MNHAVYILSVWLHVIAASLWIGGMLFLALVLVPALRKLPDRRLAAELVRASGRRFRGAGWAALGVLTATGLVNLDMRGIGIAMMADAAFWRSAFGSVLAVKLALIVAILGLSLVHDFLIGPRASVAMARVPDSSEARRLRRLASWFGRLNLLIALVVAACGVMLVRGRPW